MMADGWQEELRVLIDRQCEGVLTDAEAARLDELVCANEDSCRFYCEYTSLVGMLFLEHAEDESPESILAGWVKTPLKSQCERQSGSTVLGFLGDVFHAGMQTLGRPLVLSLLLVVGIPGILLTLLLIQIGAQRDPGLAVHPDGSPRHVAVSVAQVVRIHECAWKESGGGVSTGESLIAGQKIQLRRGLIELRFNDGARVVLEGPVTFDAQTARQGFLYDGSLAADVPKEAKGFTIATPSAKVVDLGTRFGVSVSTDGTVETHVFEGKVEVTSDASSTGAPPLTRRLETGDALEVKPSDTGPPRLVARAAQPDRFVQHVPDTLLEPTIIFAHYGDADPTTEGWKLQGSHLTKLGKGGYQVGPTNENGTAAWSLRSPGKGKYVYYAVTSKDSLTPDLLAEAKENGSVLRASVWLNPRSKHSTKDSLCQFGYCYNMFAWTLNVSLDPQGNQVLSLRELSSTSARVIPIPDSRDQYVDYEIRRNPGAKGADVLVNGRYVVRDIWKEDYRSYPKLQFGMKKAVATECRFSRFEWGVFRDKPGKGAKEGGNVDLNKQ
ncbi:MAG: FecR domain-containing protein [Pirellulales bacterium]|nr:FecR domain-containing protein [Pirellulales bacterium]